MPSITGSFDRHEDAITALQELEAFGVSPQDMKMAPATPGSPTLLSVHLDDDRRAGQVVGLMQQHGAAGPDASATQYEPMGWSSSGK